MKFTGSNKDVAQFVADLLTTFEFPSQLITITTRGSSEDCSVHIVTDTSSEDTVKKTAQFYYLQPTSI